MLAIGGLLTCAAVLVLAAVAPAFRSDNPPRWATYGWVGEVVTLVIVCTLAIGIGYLGAGAIHAFQTGVDYLDLALLAGVVLITVVIRRQWQARARARALEGEASLHVLVPESGDASSGDRTAPAEGAPLAASEPPPPHRAERQRSKAVRAGTF